MRRCRSDPGLDLVHLSRQCQGDRELEAELLRLFRLQLRALSTQLSDLSAPESKARTAHKLRGSALAVGTGRVARAAKAIEEKALAARGDARHLEAMSQAVAALEAAEAEVVAEIELICG